MANTIITPSIIAREALRQLKNNLVMAESVHREYKNEFVKVGDTVAVRKPVKFVAKDGATRVNQDVTESSLNIVINKRKHVSWKFSTQDLTLKIEDYTERYIKPAAIALANTIDADGCSLYKDIYNLVGTPGTTPATFASIASVAQRLDEEACPQDMRHMVLNPAAHWGLVAGDFKGYFEQNLASDLLRKGFLGRIGNVDFAMDQNVKTHTNGTRGNGAINGATASGATTLNIDGIGASATLKAGDVFTIAGVYAVNQDNYETTGSLRNFVVLADATANGSGEVTVSVSPTLIEAGAASLEAYATVDALPADNAVVTFLSGAGSSVSPQNLSFHKDAFALVTCPLEVPQGVPFAARQTYDNLSIRIVKDYDIAEDEEIIRMDILYGWKTIYPELACRLAG